jgi:hypothetical protein
VIATDFETPKSVPVIVELAELCTAVVLIAKVAVDAPLATVTERGTLDFELPAARLTVTPPAGAGPFKATVPVDDEPPVTVAGETDRLVRDAGLIVRVAGRKVPRREAVTTAEFVLETAVVVTEKVAVFNPAATVT